MPNKVAKQSDYRTDADINPNTVDREFTNLYKIAGDYFGNFETNDGNTANSVTAGLYFSSDMPRCYVYDSAMPAVSTASFTTITFDTASYDVGNMWDSGSATRITAPYDGLYIFTGQTIWASNATGFRSMRFLLNGTNVGQFSAPAVSGGFKHHFGLQTIIRKMDAGDYMEWAIYQNSGGNLTPDSGANSSYVTAAALHLF